MTADGIHELGKDEVDRITAKMEKVKEQIGFTAELKDFFELVRTKEDLMPFHNPEVVMIDFNGIHERMSAHLDSVFQLRLKAGFQIKRTEAFCEASASAEYVPGSKNLSVLELFTWPYPTLKLIT
jgi:uncharacterized protein (DUF885 family)